MDKDDFMIWPSWNNHEATVVPVRPHCKTCEGSGTQYNGYIASMHSVDCRSCIAAFKRQFLKTKNKTKGKRDE